MPHKRQRFWSPGLKKILTAWAAPWVGGLVGTSSWQGSTWRLSTLEGKTTGERMFSWWTYPAYLANPNTKLHGSNADEAGWDESERETAQWVDAKLAALAPTRDHESHHTP